MATRTLLKLKPNLYLPLRFYRNPTLALTRPIAPVARPESPSLSLFEPSAVSFPGTLSRQMGTARSPRGASRRDDDDDDDDGDFDDEDVDMDDKLDLDDDEFGDTDFDEFEDEDEEEEKPKGKKKTYPKKW
ncbi:hypothetical protein E2542_SST09410 [Spatholobus suberectus]|nr:hypothetical protein E2542_SST09410 [Spatholobus suberectus]